MKSFNSKDNKDYEKHIFQFAKMAQPHTGIMILYTNIHTNNNNK